MFSWLSSKFHSWWNIDLFNKAELSINLCNLKLRDEQEIAQIIHDHPNIVHQTNRDDKTLLMIACSQANPNLDVIKILIDAKSDVNAKEEIYNKTCLMYACANKNKELVKILINAKADINQKDFESKTAIMLACDGSNPDKELIKILLDAEIH